MDWQSLVQAPSSKSSGRVVIVAASHSAPEASVVYYLHPLVYRVGTADAAGADQVALHLLSARAT